MRFHISGRGEVATCKAQPGNCPIKSDHYATRQEAESAQSSKNFSKLSKFQTPKNLNPEPLTHEKAIKLLDPNNTELNGFMIGGSVLYNLDTPESDVDIFIITGFNDKNRSSTSNEIDVQAVSVKSFLKSLSKSSPEAVDRVLSGKLNMEGSKYEAMIAATRYNPFRYNARRKETVESQFKILVKSEPNSQRTEKFIKRAIKEIHLGNRLGESDWSSYSPVFTSRERRKFFIDLEELRRINRVKTPQYIVNELESEIKF